MKNRQSKGTDRLTFLCWLYTGLSALFYLLLPIVYSFPFLTFIGAFAPYHLLILGMLLQDSIAIVPSYIIGVISVSMIISYALAYIVTFILACRKHFLPFGILALIGTAIDCLTILAAIVLNIQDISFQLLRLCSLIGNVFFCIAYMRNITPKDRSKEHEDMKT